MNSTFATRNLYAAASLRAVGADYTGLTIAADGKAVFTFSDTDGTLPDLERQYFRRTFPDVQPAALIDHLMALRDGMARAKGGR